MAKFKALEPHGTLIRNYKSKTMDVDMRGYEILIDKGYLTV